MKKQAKQPKPPQYPEHGAAREYWCAKYLERRGVKYIWGPAEGGRLNGILAQIRDLSDDDPLTMFKQIVDMYPITDWWYNNHYTLHSLNKYFNPIISKIKSHAKTQTGVDESYLANLAKRATGG